MWTVNYRDFTMLSNIKKTDSKKYQELRGILVGIIEDINALTKTQRYEGGLTLDQANEAVELRRLAERYLRV